MNKNIYEMLNDSNINIEDYEKTELNDIEKKKMKKNFSKIIKSKKNSRKGKIAAALVIGVTAGLFGTNMGETVLAGINMVATDIGSKLGVDKNLDEYKTVIDKSVTNNGITMQLNEVILDGDELIVSTTVKSHEKPISEGGIHPFGTIYINGKEVKGGAGGSAKEIDEYTMEDILAYDLDNISLDGDLNVKIKYSNALLNGETVKGEWEFEFKTNGEELALDTKNTSLDYSFTLENGDIINLENYRSNEVGQKISYSQIKGSSKGSYSMVLRGTDNLGNKVEFYNSHGSPKGGTFKIERIDGLLSSEAKSITLAPYAVKMPEKSGRMDNNYVKIGEEFTIDLTKLK